jgi:AraC family transcriptional regulator of adaptative response / DNA-3-methyladenine glycosylase II
MLDEAGVDGLAGSLNIGARHLRRLFARNLGAPPVAVAQTRRLDFARRLIDETRLPVTEIAFSAGFSSLRRFNDAFLRTYGRPPSEMRRLRPSAGESTRSSSLILKLFYRPPFDWAALSRFLRDRAIPGVELVSETSYRRTVQNGWRMSQTCARRTACAALVPAVLQRPAYHHYRVRTCRSALDPLTIGEHLGGSCVSTYGKRQTRFRVPGA